MRILKNKIANKIAISQKISEEKSLQEATIKETQPDSPLLRPTQTKQTQPNKRERVPGRPVTSETDRATKNIPKNFGKAICTFACSYIATPYLTPLATNYNVELSEFRKFVAAAKDGIESISSFRNLLLVKLEDDKTANFKRVFAAISEVFIKYFSVNWIFSGRLTHKETHLKARFKLLRRIKNPESFTFLSSSGWK